MHTITKKEGHLLVEFNDGFGSEDIVNLIRHEAGFDNESGKNSIWLVDKHPAQLSIGELPNVVDVAATLPLEQLRGRKTAIVTHHSVTRVALQILADGLQHRLPLRCRTFKTIEEAHRWLDFVNMPPDSTNPDLSADL